MLSKYLDKPLQLIKNYWKEAIEFHSSSFLINEHIQYAPSHLNFLLKNYLLCNFRSLEIIPVNSNDGCILNKNKNISVKNVLLKKTKVFVPFGWNDTNKDIGKKKTFNIIAPEKEVYPHVILKTKQNRKIIELPKHKKIQKRIQPPTI